MRTIQVESKRVIVLNLREQHTKTIHISDCEAKASRAQRRADDIAGFLDRVLI